MRHGAVVVFVALLAAVSTASSVWPKPKSMNVGTDLFVVYPTVFAFSATGHKSELLLDAFLRYTRIIFADVPPSQVHNAYNFTVLSGADVNVLTDDEQLGQHTDESYHLNIHHTSDRVNITANSVFGAIRALETLSQLFIDGVVLPDVTVFDEPRFAIRASMIDTSRHWYPVKTILQHLDAMAFTKMNVLHWHIVDEQAFPLELNSFPLLAETGAYAPSHVYTHSDIAVIVQYARQRGIRVIPEIDTPGHVRMGWTSYKGILTECYDAHGKPDGSTGPLDPTRDATYEFVSKLFTEVKTLFPDAFVHLGGDEVPFDCWQSNPAVQDFMAKHPELKSYEDLESYYVGRLMDSLGSLNISNFIFWQEIFDNGVKLTPNSIVDVWKGDDWQEELQKVLSAKKLALLSAPFYLNYISYGEDWPNYYKIEPLLNCTGCDASLLMGIEMCMWSEFVDSTNFLPRQWPRGAAVAERAWSEASVRDIDEAAMRLHELRCKMIARGIPAEPVTIDQAAVPRFCPKEWDQDSWTRIMGSL